LLNRFASPLNMLAALSLVLAGTAVHATGYQLILAKDAPHAVVVKISQGGTSRVYRVKPGLALEIKADQHYAFRFKDPLGASLRFQEVTFQLHRTGASGAISQFQFWSAMPPMMRVFSCALTGVLALKEFQGVTGEADNVLTWRSGALAWCATPPPFLRSAPQDPAEEVKNPAPASPEPEG